MDYSEVIQKVRNSIAFVALFDSKNQNIGTGSGFVYQNKNILVTCNHVVEGAASLILKFVDKKEYIGGKVVLRDDEHDLALIKFSDDSRTPLEDGSKETIKEGMSVIFAGYPFGMKNLTTHHGIISAIVRDVTGIESYFLDGTVNSGNSGCPLMNKTGGVIGVVNAKARQQGELLEQVEKMQIGAVSLHGTDLVAIYKALIANVQIGVGYAVPVSYIPNHKETQEDKNIVSVPPPEQEKIVSKDLKKKHGK